MGISNLVVRGHYRADLLLYANAILSVRKTKEMLNNKYIKVLGLMALIFVFMSVFAFDLDAQCPMCKMAAESNLKAGGTQGRGLNNGILYLLSTPYLIIGGIAYVWWRNRKKQTDEGLEEAAPTT